MSDLKLYVYDLGWAGADLIWARDEEEAKDFVIAEYMPEYEKRAAEHEKYHGVNGLKEYRAHNPAARHLEEYKNRSFGVTLVEQKPGIAHRTAGE